MTALNTQLLQVFKSSNHKRLKAIITFDDLRETIVQCINEVDLSKPKYLPLFETLLEHNTVDKNFKSALFSCILMKDYDIARLILKHSPATIPDRPLLHQHLPPDDIFREYAVRFARHNVVNIPELICTTDNSDTLVAVLQEVPVDYEIDKHFMAALMYRERPQAIMFAVDRFIGANPDLAADVVIFILSGEVQDLDDLIVPILSKYPPTAEHKTWISASISPGYLPIPVLDELLKHYEVEKDARLLLEASASENPVVFAKVVDLFTEEQARTALKGTPALQTFLPQTFDKDRQLLREHVAHLDNLQQQRILTDAVQAIGRTAHTRKI